MTRSALGATLIAATDARQTVDAGRYRFSAGFEPLNGHHGVVVRWRPKATARAHVVFLPAFGDEMNQTRRMVRLVAEALAARDVECTAFDLHGTGDSTADFSEATIERWIADCRAIAAKIDPDRPLILVGCRLGAALAVHASHLLAHPPASLVAWAPVLQGKTQLSAMVRAARVAAMQGAGSGNEDPHAVWASGKAAMVGGYPVSAELATQLDSFDATRPPKAGRATLIDIRLAVGAQAPKAPQALLARASEWSEQGVPTDVRIVAGPWFWNVADLVDVPELVDATVGAVEQALEGASA